MCFGGSKPDPGGPIVEKPAHSPAEAHKDVTVAQRPARKSELPEDPMTDNQPDPERRYLRQGQTGVRM